MCFTSRDICNVVDVQSHSRSLTGECMECMINDLWHVLIRYDEGYEIHTLHVNVCEIQFFLCIELTQSYVRDTINNYRKRYDWILLTTFPIISRVINEASVDSIQIATHLLKSSAIEGEDIDQSRIGLLMVISVLSLRHFFTEIHSLRYIPSRQHDLRLDTIAWNLNS